MRGLKNYNEVTNMSEEKTIEQLEAEYKTLLLEKLDREKKAVEELEQKKQAELLAAQKKKERDELKEEIKKEMGFTAISRLDESNKKPVNMVAEAKNFEEFKAGIIAKKQKQGKNVQGLKYEDLVQTFHSAGC